MVNRGPNLVIATAFGPTRHHAATTKLRPQQVRAKLEIPQAGEGVNMAGKRRRE